MEPEEYTSFEEVKWHDATIYQVLSRGGTIEQCVIALANQKRDLEKRLRDLELIAPRKMRWPDGSVRIYRAPEHLLPDPA